MLVRERVEIERALRNAERARTYIHSERIAVAARGTMATTTDHYVRARDGACLVEMQRAYGSDLCGLDTAIDTLRALLAPKGE